MNLGLHVRQYPSGRFGFDGSVPAALAYEALDGGPADPAQLEVAALCGPGFAKKIKHRSWESREAASAEARALGYEVRNA